MRKVAAEADSDQLAEGGGGGGEGQEQHQPQHIHGLGECKKRALRVLMMLKLSEENLKR